MKGRTARRFVATAAAACAAFVAMQRLAGGYAFLDGRPTWPSGTIPMHLQLGSSGPLSDGSQNWGQPAEAALAAWNEHIDRIQFTVVRNSTAPIRENDRVNSVFFSSTIFGRDFGENTLAVATTWLIRSTAERTESDVVFNNRHAWDSYRGRWRSGTPEFRRVAMHEFGHTLGLDHPHDHGQTVDAIMNQSSMRDPETDALRADDIRGVWDLYGLGNGTVAFPSRAESLDFRNQLEAKYRDGLGRPSSSTYVDAEGDVVWTQEYIRYRVNRCAHVRSMDRVLFQIQGVGIAPVCGTAATGDVAFPPRNESLEFRRVLEDAYRFLLNRQPARSFVDLEGAVIWTQEYLRYRVNRCGHADAIQRVMQQIDGAPPPPTCQQVVPPGPTPATCSITCWACTSGNSYGAVAYSPSSSACGFSFGYATRDDAEQRAITECGRGDCRTAVWFFNACGAVARSSRAVGWAIAGSRAEAEAQALVECRARSASAADAAELRPGSPAGAGAPGGESCGLPAGESPRGAGQ